MVRQRQRERELRLLLLGCRVTLRDAVSFVLIIETVSFSLKQRSRKNTTVSLFGNLK